MDIIGFIILVFGAMGILTMPIQKIHKDMALLYCYLVMAVVGMMLMIF